MREKRQRKQQEAAEQLIKEQTLLKPSPICSDSAKINSNPDLTTATEEPVQPSDLLQRQPHHSTGRNKNSTIGKRKASSSLKASHASPVQDQQPSQLRSHKLSLPAEPLEQSSLANPQQPTSLENPCQPSTPKKPQRASLLARTQHPVLLPLRAQQSTSPIKPQQSTSPIKPQQSSLQVQPQEQSSSLIFPRLSTQDSFPQSSSPVKAHHPSSPVKDQSFAMTAPQPGLLQPQQPSKIHTQRVVTNDLSETESVQEMGTLLTEKDSTMDKTDQATKKGKGKPKASIKPSVGKKTALPKGPQKRKGTKIAHAVVAAVKPLSPSTSTMPSEPLAKKAAWAIADSSSKEAVQSPRTCLEIPTEIVDSVDIQQNVPMPVTDLGNPDLPPPAKVRRSSSSAPKTPLPAEDEFERLMWELSGGRLEEAEIDLDAGKDEDELLLELSEMIDS